mmetsp:Transcript_988/g.2094  ORF Transcript_988/g.2094 Transcript_988/m.2094 type:complete len:735 (-) Transcript_988:331-2535(-)
MQKRNKGSESIKVVFRVRPLNSREKQDDRKIATIAHEEKGIIELRIPSTDGGYDTSKTFAFDAVFSENSNQRHIYDVCAAPVVQSVLEGYNGTIFAYGQTGAGKTHTMEGVNEPSELRGIIPNTFEHMFDHIALNSAHDKYLVRASYFEIYNEEIRDLLSPQKSAHGLELKESSDSGVYIKDLTSVVVKSVAEINSVLQKGKKNRSVGFTLMNAGSSRSHSIFSIVIECCSVDSDKNEHIRVGKLSLVDLAGSERQSKTGASGDRLKEATKINLSLSALGNCISALVDGKSNHVPYRDSKLTRILQDSLGGNTKTVMCANAGPADYNYDESLSTLRYASRAKNIKNKPVVNEDPKDAKLREHQEEIARLKSLLSKMSSDACATNHVPGNTANGLTEETLTEGSRLKMSKEANVLQAEAAAKMNQLRLDHQTTEERAMLQTKLEEEQKARLDMENDREDLRRKLAAMEEQLVIGGEIANNAAKHEAALRLANQELIAKREAELALTRKLNEHEEEKFNLEEKYSSLTDEVASKTKKLKKLYHKYQQAKAEIKDLEHEFLVEKNEMFDTIRELTKQLKLRDFIISSFIPPKYALLYDDAAKGGIAVWDELGESWTIPKVKANTGRIRERRVSAKGRRRPETEHARRRKMVDSNLRWHNHNAVQLDLVVPPRKIDENSSKKVASILSMDINDKVDELPPELTSTSKKYFNLDFGRKKKHRTIKGISSSRSSRPTTAL